MNKETPIKELQEESLGEQLKRRYPGWKNLPRRTYLHWKVFSRKNVIVRTIVWCAFLLAFLFGAVFHQVGRVDSLRREDDARTAAASNYRNSLRTYDLAMGDRQRCLTNVETRDTIRNVLFDYAQGIVDVLPESQLAILFRDARVSYVNTNYPPLNASDCRPEPALPECPVLLTDQRCAEIRGEQAVETVPVG